MKKMLILAALSVAATSIPLGAEAENYFRDGAKWVTEMDISLIDGWMRPFAMINNYIVTIEGDTVINGEKALKMYSETRFGDVEGPQTFSKSHKANIRTEGDKVYFWEPGTSQWLLAYDFGLEPGMSCYVYTITASSNLTVENRKKRIKCLGFSSDERYPGLVKMDLAEDDLDGYGYHQNPGTHYWLKGIGNGNVFQNNCYDYDGLCYGKLLEFSDKGGIVFKAKRDPKPEPKHSFKDGTKWVSELRGRGDSQLTGERTVTIEGDTVVNFVSALKMYEETEYTDSQGHHVAPKTLAAVIHTSSEKIFFWDEKSETWYPCYDFENGAGEGEYMYYMGPGNYYKYQRQSYMICHRISADADNPGLEVMTMREYTNGSPGGPYQVGEWIKGIGSTQGVLNNVWFNRGDVRETLVRVEVPTRGGSGEVIYRKSTSGVKALEADERSAAQVSVEGGMVRVSCAEGPVTLWTLDGRCVGRVDARQGEAEFPVSAPGIYIVKHGSKAIKVAVR